ncbi:MAG TPA: hypothetical protein VFM46_03305 [Pseudomonadales bacterium]|nr:hypothetical protein [Pseudomonadales bacterium]
MKINKALNLVITVEDEGEIVHVHCAPIRHEIFEKYHRVMARTFAAIYAEGMNIIAGPRVASLMLREIAEETPRTIRNADGATSQGNWYEGPDGIENGLMPEIRRLTNVSTFAPEGWRQVPIDVARKMGIIGDEAMREIEGQIVFFILASAMHTGLQRAQMLEAMAGLWGAQITSLNSTEYNSSLQTLIEQESTMVPASSIPS